MNKKLLFFLFILFIPLSIFSKDLKKVTLQLSWFDQFQFAGYYMAKEKGYYEEYGFDVEIRPFEFGINVSSLVNEKKVDFAVDRETLILEKVAGKKLVALYALFQESPLVLLSLKDSNINKVEDFVDKRIMTTIDDAGEVSVKAMILSKGIKTENLNFIKHTHNIMDLVNNNTDVISAYLSKTTYDLQKMGVEYNIFNPKDYAFDMYSDFLFTHEDNVKEDLSTVLAFKEASLKGWEYAYSNIEKTAEFIYENFNIQNISLDALVYEGEVLKNLSYTGSNNLGEIKPEKIQRIYDLYNVMGLTPNKIDLNRFVLYKDFVGKIDFTKVEKDYILGTKEVKMCVVPDLKPYSFIKNGKFEGFVSEYIKLLSKKTKLNYKFIKTNTIEESIEYLRNGNCEIISSLSKIEERNSFLNFTKPYIDISFGIVTKNESSFIDNLSVLKDKKIAISKKYAYNQLLKKIYPSFNFIEVEDMEEGLKKVSNSEIFAYVDLIHSTIYKIQNDYLSKLKISGKLDYSLPISIAITKKDLILKSILDKGVESISEDEVDKLVKQWASIEFKKEFDYDTLYKFLFVFLVIVFAILYRQRVLNNVNIILQEKVKEKTLELQKMNNELENRVNTEVSENLRKDVLLSRQAKMVAMGEMIQNIAHQWRQPLSIITTGASGLKLQKELKGNIEDEFLDEILTKIVNTSVDLSKTIDSFMNFFKKSSQKNVFSIKNTVEKTLKIFDYNNSEKKIKILKNIDAIEIVSYENELMQILINILNNSKEALNSNNIDTKIIFISGKKIGENIFIEIKDNAGGIPDEILSKIYEPYFTTKHQFHGTGIGLFMCQEILTKHMHGEINTKNCDFEYDGKNYRGALTTIKIEI